MESRLPTIYISKELDRVDVWSNQYFTVWLRPTYENNHSGDIEHVQVELRTLTDGTMQIFTHLDKVEVKDFKDWYSVDEEKE